jgi:hypothetical protein
MAGSVSGPVGTRGNLFLEKRRKGAKSFNFRRGYVTKELAFSLAISHVQRVLTEGSHTCIASRVSVFGGNESRVFDSRTREIASCERVTWVTKI